MNTLTFEKISCFDRLAEPVTVSIPFAAEALTDPSQLTVWGGDRRLAHQGRVLARWPDGSVKWLLVHLQPDLPGNREATLTFEVLSGPAAVPGCQDGVASVSVVETEHGLAVDTGPLSFVVPNDGFLPVRDVCLDGEGLWGDAPLGGFELRFADGEDGPVQAVSTAAGPVTLVLASKRDALDAIGQTTRTGPAQNPGRAQPLAQLACRRRFTDEGAHRVLVSGEAQAESAGEARRQVLWQHAAGLAQRALADEVHHQHPVVCQMPGQGGEPPSVGRDGAHGFAIRLAEQVVDDEIELRSPVAAQPADCISGDQLGALPGDAKEAPRDVQMGAIELDTDDLLRPDGPHVHSCIS